MVKCKAFLRPRAISPNKRGCSLQLAEQQAYNRSLIEASADALFAIAPDGTITDVNEEATRLTGYSRKHLINSRFSEYFTEPELARAGVQQTLAEKSVISYELVLITRYGRRIPVSFNAGVFTDTAGARSGNSGRRARHHRAKRHWKSSSATRSSTRDR